MRVVLCIPTLNRADLARKAILSAYEGLYRPDETILLDNSGKGKSLPHIQDIIYPTMNVHMIPSAINKGVSGSWNYFFNTFGDDSKYIIVANDDITFHHLTIHALVTAALSSDALLFHGSGQHGNAFSLFLLKYNGYKQIGAFDEQLFPAYFEDNDYAYRIKLAGQMIVEVPEATFDHAGSSTLKAYSPAERQQHHHDFTRNALYYQRKWGGLPGKEKYIKPFNQ